MDSAIDAFSTLFLLSANHYLGKPIPANDAWIAASCLEQGARLMSYDAHFSEVDGLLRWEAWSFGPSKRETEFIF